MRILFASSKWNKHRIFCYILVLYSKLLFRSNYLIDSENQNKYDKVYKLIEAFSGPYSQFLKHLNHIKYDKFFKIIYAFFRTMIKIFEIFIFCKHCPVCSNFNLPFVVKLNDCLLVGSQNTACAAVSFNEPRHFPLKN